MYEYKDIKRGEVRMTREQLLRVLRKEARRRDLTMIVDRVRGRGSHYIVTVGERRTTVQSGEITPLMERTIRRQLGLD